MRVYEKKLDIVAINDEGREFYVDHIEMFDDHVGAEVFLTAKDNEDDTDYIIWYFTQDNLIEAILDDYDKVIFEGKTYC